MTEKFNEFCKYALVPITGYGKHLEPIEWGPLREFPEFDEHDARDYITELFDNYNDGFMKVEIWETGFTDDRSKWKQVKFATMTDEEMGRLVDDAASSRYMATTHFDDKRWEQFKIAAKKILEELERTVPLTK